MRESDGPARTVHLSQNALGDAGVAALVSEVTGNVDLALEVCVEGDDDVGGRRFCVWSELDLCGRELTELTGAWAELKSLCISNVADGRLFEHAMRMGEGDDVVQLFLIIKLLTGANESLVKWRCCLARCCRRIRGCATLAWYSPRLVTGGVRWRLRRGWHVNTPRSVYVRCEGEAEGSYSHALSA